MPSGYQKVVEDVPDLFTRRQGDWTAEGGNNTLIVLGTDRCRRGPATIEDGLGTVAKGGKKAGSILAVAGRKDPRGNPDLDADDTTLYLSMRTEVDKNLNTGGIFTDDTGPAAVVKSDHVRIVFRKNLKIATAEPNSHIFFDEGSLVADLQDKVRLTLNVDGGDTLAVIEAEGNIVEVKGDGTITVDSKSKVTVNTRTAEVNADDTTINSRTTINGETTIKGDVTIIGTTTAGAIVASTIAAGAGGTGRPGPSSFRGNLSVLAGDVTADSVSLKKHKHLIVGAKGGPDTLTTLVPIP